MKSHKKANFRAAISILCAVTMLATLFSGLSLNPSAAGETEKDYEFIDTFDTELDTEKWTKGESVKTVKKSNGFVPEKEFEGTRYTVPALNVTATAGSYENLTKNALVRKEDSPAGDQLLEVVFSGDYTGDSDEAKIKGWCTGVVARANTDDKGNLTGGYIVMAKLTNDQGWYNTPEWIGCWKFNADGSFSTNPVKFIELKNLPCVSKSICKLQVAITDDASAGTTLSYGLYRIGGANQSWIKMAEDSYTDTNEPILSGKSGITLMGQSANAPVVDFYNFSDKVKRVEPSDKKAVFDSEGNYNIAEWNFGNGITERKELTDSFADTNRKITPATKALTLVGTNNRTNANTMMKNIDSATGNRELSMVFGENFGYVSENDKDWHNNSGAGIAVRATVNVDGNLTGGYVVVAKTTGDIWYNKPVSMSIHKVNADGSFSSALKSKSIEVLNNSEGVWNIKMKLDVTVNDNDDGSTTIDYSIFAYNYSQKAWYDAISDTYTDETPINNPIFAGKSGAVVYSDGNTTPKIQIYEFADNAVYPSTDLTDGFDSLSQSNWQFGSGITGKEITAGYADSTDMAIRLTGTAGDDNNNSGTTKPTTNTMLRKATSPEGSRFIETEFGGYLNDTLGGDGQVKAWGAGIIANATDDGAGNLTGGYVLIAKMCQDPGWFYPADWMLLYRVNSDGTREHLGDIIDISALGCVTPNKESAKKIKLQLSVVANADSTTLHYALLVKNTEGNWVEKYSGTYEDKEGTAAVSGKSGVIVMSQSGNAPIVDIYSFKDVTPQAPEISTVSLADVTMGDEYTAEIKLLKEIPNAVKFTVTEGKLPAGLFLDELTGKLSGIPLIDGKFDITVQVADNFGNSYTKAYSFTVNTTDDLIFIEIRKKLLGADEINDFRIVDQNADGEYDIRDLVVFGEKINK